MGPVYSRKVSSMREMQTSAYEQGKKKEDESFENLCLDSNLKLSSGWWNARKEVRKSK